MGRHADLVQTELESLSHGVLIGLLENAEDEEREMSYHRRLLHKRIDSLDVASGVLERADAELLSALHLEGGRSRNYGSNCIIGSPTFGWKLAGDAADHTKPCRVGAGKVLATARLLFTGPGIILLVAKAQRAAPTDPPCVCWRLV